MKVNIVLKDIYGSDLKGIGAMLCDAGYGENIERFTIENQHKIDGPVLGGSAENAMASISKVGR